MENCNSPDEMRGVSHKKPANGVKHRTGTLAFFAAKLGCSREHLAACIGSRRRSQRLLERFDRMVEDFAAKEKPPTKPNDKI